MSSTWTRYVRLMKADRGDGPSVKFENGSWSLSLDGETRDTLHLPADALERAIECADERFVPEGWAKYSPDRWTRPGWVVKCEGASWGILRGDAPATRRTFVTPYRARAWVEARLDRTSASLRGPKPRAGMPSHAMLPDVRVTEGERADALALAQALHVSFSDLVRAALAFVRGSALTSRELAVVRKRDTRQIRFVHVSNVRRQGDALLVDAERVDLLYWPPPA